MKTKRLCCIPNCNTYDTVDNFLRFPIDIEWRKKWLNAIPIKNWIVDHSTILCRKHFKKGEVALYTKYLDKDTGEPVVLKSSTPLLKQGSVPTIFNTFIEEEDRNENVYENVDIFELAERDAVPETFGEAERTDITDFIIDYYYLTQYFEIKLNRVLNGWKTHKEEEFVLFFKIANLKLPQVISSITVDNSLKVTVCLNGREMDPGDLTWIVPITRKINRWSQLSEMLEVFGK